MNEKMTVTITLDEYCKLVQRSDRLEMLRADIERNIRTGDTIYNCVNENLVLTLTDLMDLFVERKEKKQ